MAFKNKKASRKVRTERASVILRGVINRIRRRIENKIRGKVEARAKELKLDINNEDVKNLIEQEITKILTAERSAIETAAKTAIAKPDITTDAVGGVLARVEEKLDRMGAFPMPLPVPQKTFPDSGDFEGKKLTDKLGFEIQSDDEKAKSPKIGTPVKGGKYDSRYMVPYGFVAPMFKQMTGPQIIEKVQSLYHVPFDVGDKEKRKIRETYALIPDNPKPGEKVFAWAYIHWDPKSKNLVYDVIEPTMSAEDKKLLEKLEDKLEEKLDVLYIPEKKGKHKEYLRKKIGDIIDLFGWKLDQETASKIEYYSFRDYIGLGRIEPLMHDPNIEDISCDGVNIPVYIFHRRPEFSSMRTNVYFTNKEVLDNFAIKLAQKSKKSISVARPLLDASLPDGSRLQATLGSDIARRGSNFTIRKFLKDPLTPTKLMDFKTSSALGLAYIWMCIEYGKSILVSGATATGKTSFLNATSLFIRPELKVISIEDTAELMLSLPNWVPQVARQGYGEKSYGAVDMFDLLKASLRQRPDYVIVGEVRGQEASVMFQGMATGHPALATIHADTLQRLVDRLTTPPISLSAALLENLDIVIFLERTKISGKFIRRINRIYEVAGVNVRESKIIPNKLFEWDPVNDEINMSGKSLILKKIADFKGMEYDMVFKEIERRALFLEWLKMNNIFDFKQFSTWVQSYYNDPEKIMTMVLNDVRRKVQKEGNQVGSEKLRELSK